MVQLVQHAKQFETMLCIDSPLTNNFHWAKEVNVCENIKCLQDKNRQIIFVNRRFARDKTQSMQGLSTRFDWTCLTRYSSSLIMKITIFFSLHQETSVEIITGRYSSYFHKKNQNSLCKSNWLVKPISILQWIDRFSVEKTSSIYWA